MSIVSMKKMSLVAHKGDRSRLLKIFTRFGCVEISAPELLDATEYPHDSSKREGLESKRLKTSFALTFLREMTKEMGRIDKDKAPKMDLKRINRLVSFDEYDATARDEVEIFSKISEMEVINSRVVDIKSERARLAALKEQLAPYLPLEAPFSELTDTASCAVIVGTVNATKLDALKEALPECCELAVYDGDKSVCAAVVCHKEVKGEVLNALTAADFVRCGFDYDVTAAAKTEEIDNRLTGLEEERKACVTDAVNFLPVLDSLKILHDYYDIEIAKCAAVESSPHTQTAFVMEGWVPAEKAEALEKEVNEKCKRTEIFFRDPYDTETPPTQTKNTKVVNAFAGITEMFGAPNYREQDPNMFVALFYFLFFGIMISDAGYGLILAIACFVLFKVTKPVKNSGRMLLMFGFCGISTVIWGALFGGWFAVTIPEGSFLDKLTWFNPLNEPLKMFMLSLGMGVLQIGTGFALKGVALCREGHPVHAIFNQFSWVIIFIGLLLVSPKLMLFLGAISTEYEWFATCATVGMYVALVGAVMLVIGGAIGKKNPIKMVTGAFGNVYGAINVVSDLLSYSRLFGLGLTTGVIGYVVNMLADIIVNTFFGGYWAAWILAAIILVIGHTFNIAINLLSAYVHNSRLQYIEFFGRFYEGNGRAFMPIGGSAKYTYPDN